MFASINFNILMSMAITAGCLVSKVFAASVVAGSFGVFIACAVIIARSENSPAGMKMRSMLRQLNLTA